MDTDARDNDRWMLLAGPAFTVLAIAAAVLNSGAPGETESAAKVIEHYKDHEAGVVISTFVWGPAAAMLLVFVSRLRAGIDDRARAARSLVVAGGTLAAAGIVIGASVGLANMVAADEGFEEVSQTLNVLNSALWIPLVIGLAVMLLGAGLSVLRTGILPSWLGWVAVVVGVLSLLGPGGFVGYLVAPLWVGVAGLMLYLRSTADVPDVVV